ncbi:family 16 glycosylhydrolase [Colwellia hornerae]|uniref:Family 16 glycosylhydrolase n=1 Tax=Colwellia hornerae TaxID=89402 RepID=A0A5C6QFP8_9GAMM|nr:family 16 glycosylhydrolase [Colwellia hornerae]TWX52602.1 family 16 glycosylhydrolase [Colwellia hornerae]TWX58365.1 family 16 glycosylhydrolase [Colwellia hornerae]TWX67417.1 family 16 glycosylhydrolase [Colwellia hornerae]
MKNKQSNKKSLLVLVLILIPVLLIGQALISDDESYQSDEAHLASAHQGDQQSDHLEKNNTVVWAINVGGSEYVGVDGISYQADQSIITGDIGTIENIKGSQDSFIYQSFRFGNIGIKQPMENGLYDIIFKFAEPEDNAMDARVFNVFAEDKLVISDLNVRLARDGKHISALARAVYNVEVTDVQLDINFQAINGQPILSALIVRKKEIESKQWQLVWSDEFNYQGKPDPNKWSYDIWPARKVNSEDQTYTDSLKNVHVKDGNLVITAYKENLGDAKYSSGRIHSQGKGDFLYGRVDVRAKLPAGQGTWSAIWMLPSDAFKYSSTCQEDEDWQGSATCDAWPNSGEIDIMEHVGYDMQTIHGTVHNKAYYWANWQQRKGSIEGQNVEKAFHLYSVEWTPESITVLFDNVPYFFYSNESSGWRAWPYDHPYHVILNLAIGGMWGKAGGPIDDSIFPVSMEVDFVRIFKPLNQ